MACYLNRRPRECLISSALMIREFCSHHLTSHSKESPSFVAPPLKLTHLAKCISCPALWLASSSLCAKRNGSLQRVCLPCTCRVTSRWIHCQSLVALCRGAQEVQGGPAQGVGVLPAPKPCLQKGCADREQSTRRPEKATCGCSSEGCGLGSQHIPGPPPSPLCLFAPTSVTQMQ